MGSSKSSSKSLQKLFREKSVFLFLELLMGTYVGSNLWDLLGNSCGYGFLVVVNSQQNSAIVRVADAKTYVNHAIRGTDRPLWSN